VVIHVQESVAGMIVAIAHVGTRVFISQGPPIAVQFAEVWIRPFDVYDAVEYNVRFAAMRTRREEDGRKQRRDGAQLEPM